MNFKSIILLTFSGLLACNPEKITTQTDRDGVVTQLPFFWKSSISDGIRAEGLNHGYIINENSILCVAMRKSSDPKKYGEYYLQLKDVNTGKNIWIWDDFYKKSIGSLRKSINLYPGKMLLHDGPYDYLINTGSGTTIWKKENKLYSASPYPAFLDDKFYFTANGINPSKENKIQEGIYAGEVSTSNISELVTPKYSEEYAVHKQGLPYYIGSLINIEAFKKDNINYLVVPHVEAGPIVKNSADRSFFGLFNLTQHKWMYERVPLGFHEDGASASVMPVVNSEKVYMTSLNSVSCFDVMSGKKNWEYRLSSDLVTPMDMLLVNNKLLVNCTNAKMYCFDAYTGNVLWEQQSSAIASDLYHQDGVIYWIRTKNLLAVNIETGKVLWDLPSLDDKEENRPDSWHWGFVTGIPAKDGKKGKIFATTNLNLYCFEAIK